MDSELKAEWCSALRSGKFKQAQMQLRDKGAYCCLGVLCRVAGIKIARSGTEVAGGQDYHPIAAAIGDYEFMRTLMGKNDSGAKFPEIADYIEARA